MRCHVDYQNLHSIGFHLVNHTISQAETRGAMPLPLTAQRLVVKPLNQPEPLRPRDPDDVLPFFISGKDLDRKPVKTPRCVSVLKDSPHTAYELYHI